MTPARLSHITFPGSDGPWRALGLLDGRKPHLFGDIAVGFGHRLGAPFGLTFEVDHALPGAASGLPAGCEVIAGMSASPDATDDRVVAAVDHVVILTDSLDRTGAGIEQSLRSPCRRVRDAGGGRRQGFHLLANTLLEVVESPGHPAGTHTLWGITVSVADLDALCIEAGDLVSPPKEAVQPGRRISTVREAAGLGVPVALMTPRAGSAP